MTLTREDLLLNVKVSLKSNDPKQKQKSIDRWNKFKNPTYTNLYDELPNDLQWFIEQIIFNDEQKPMIEYNDYIRDFEPKIRYRFETPMITNNTIFERKVFYERIVDNVNRDFEEDIKIMRHIINLSTNKLIDMERKKGMEYPNLNKITKPNLNRMYNNCGYRFVNFNKWRVDKVREQLNKQLQIFGNGYSWDGVKHTSDLN